MAKKCKKNEHNWMRWELQWDPKEDQIWTRQCVGCGVVEKSLHAPPPEPTRAKVIQWLEVQMSK